MKCFITVLLHALLYAFSEEANILIVLPIPWYSHTETFMPVFKELAARGHNVTMVSPFHQKEAEPNWTKINTNSLLVGTRMEKLVSEMVDLNSKNKYLMYPGFWRMYVDLMEVVFQDKTLQELIEAKDLKYDLIMIEPFFAQEPLVALGHKFNAPVIALHSLSFTPWQAFLTGNELSFHLLPNIRTSYSNKMTFWERLDNTLINLIEFSVLYFHFIPQKEKQMEKYMVYPGSQNRPPLLTMLRNVSLTLIDYHFSILYPEPFQPNTIPVGGLSLTNVKELPKDLNNTINNAREGVIFLSFGSLLKGNIIAEKAFGVLIEAFRELKQTVIMKWEKTDVPNKPKNVILKTWVPQASILAHPNVKMFITHAGLHGITEAAYFGVPVLCVPLFADQEYNSKFSELVGSGITLLLKDITKVGLLNGINEILNNPKYKETAVERSKILKDKPQSALDTSIYWIEYVIKHKGAGHLKPGRQDLSLYEILGLDILLFFIISMTILTFVVYKLLKFYFSFFYTSNKSKKD